MAEQSSCVKPAGAPEALRTRHALVRGAVDGGFASWYEARRMKNRELIALMEGRLAELPPEVIEDVPLYPDKKYCPRCDKDKGWTAFGKNKSTKTGLASWCKKCCRKYQKDLRACRRHDAAGIKKDRERGNQYGRNYRSKKANRDHLNAGARRRNATPERRRSHRSNHFVREYGINLDQVEHMIAVQEHCCPICGEEFTDDRRWHVDHDHAANRVRGVLCHNCNTGIGMLRDDPSLLRSAIEYLERYGDE